VKGLRRVDALLCRRCRQGYDGSQVGGIHHLGSRVVPTGAKGGGLGVEPRAKPEADFGYRAGRAIAEGRAAGIVIVGLDRPGAQTGQGEYGGADDVAILAGGLGVYGQVFGRSLMGSGRSFIHPLLKARVSAIFRSGQSQGSGLTSCSTPCSTDGEEDEGSKSNHADTLHRHWETVMLRERGTASVHRPARTLVATDDTSISKALSTG
jgi:hypothetical protein